MIYTYRKLILIILSCLLVGVGGLIIFLQTHKPTPKKSSAPAYSVTTTGLSKTPDKLSDSFISLVESSVDRVVTTRHGNGTYTATYRNGSYKRLVYPSGGISTSLLIDVKQTKETYLFTRTGGDNTASMVYIYCAPEDQQMIHPSVCKDPGEGY